MFGYTGTSYPLLTRGVILRWNLPHFFHLTAQKEAVLVEFRAIDQVTRSIPHSAKLSYERDPCPWINDIRYHFKLKTTRDTNVEYEQRGQHRRELSME